jgi:hypothetical protein
MIKNKFWRKMDTSLVFFGYGYFGPQKLVSLFGFEKRVTTGE